MEKKISKKLLCKKHNSSAMKKQSTKHERMLFDALIKDGVPAVLGYNDGYKTVDIAVPTVKLYIEVDGIQHFTDPRQILSDLQRNHFSDGDDFRTFYATNQLVEKHCTEIARALAAVCRTLMASKS
jgi:very-short-patch-repair endonuclease